MDTIDQPTPAPVDLDLGLDLAPPRCECEHGEAAEQCAAAAVWVVTVVCTEPGCTDPAGMYLLCQECRTTWRERARRDDVGLRVRRL